MRPLRSPFRWDQRIASSRASFVQGRGTPCFPHIFSTHRRTTSRYRSCENGWKATQIPNRHEREIFSSTASPWWISPFAIIAPRLSLSYSGTRCRRLDVT